jgi:hypothetical protein
MAKFRKWHGKAIDWACCSKSLIEQVAQELGVPARAIAGAMAKEHHIFLGFDRWANTWVQHKRDRLALRYADVNGHSGVKNSVNTVKNNMAKNPNYNPPHWNSLNPLSNIFGLIADVRT